MPPAAHRAATTRCNNTVSHSGFTLLELLVVLVLGGLLVALAFPNLQQLYASAARNTERDRIVDQLAALGRESMAQRRSHFVVDAERADNGLGEAAGAGFSPYVVDVPEGWRLRVEEPVLARANGVCLGGAVTLLHNDLPPRTVRFEAPLCRVAPRSAQ